MALEVQNTKIEEALINKGVYSQMLDRIKVIFLSLSCQVTKIREIN